ncbi:hypothetical protein ZIOFF_026906 [Zingiber officinale]|uniref:Uncharacterized protein n=1 Tax=Zingiber officinale TaxID=94328 RepID=A0A8J5H5G7_ZINOF|nr:hypothetical protein ZIOFF_026906 [Zingiber officinale]
MIEWAFLVSCLTKGCAGEGEERLVSGSRIGKMQNESGILSSAFREKRCLCERDWRQMRWGRIKMREILLCWRRLVEERCRMEEREDRPEREMEKRDGGMAGGGLRWKESDARNGCSISVLDSPFYIFVLHTGATSACSSLQSPEERLMRAIFRGKSMSIRLGSVSA